MRIHIVKTKKANDKTPILPNLGSLGRVRKGSKLSRYFRHIFERVNVRKLIGTNLAVMIMASSLLPTTNAKTLDINRVNTSNASIVLKTNRPIRYPVKAVMITQSYRFYHPAIDFDGERGDSIYPVIDGVVEGVGYSNVGYGNAIIIRHEDESTSLYAHLSQINVDGGDKVTQDDVIGLMGSTGRSTGDHLHLEIRDKNGVPVNPMTLLAR